MDAPLPAIEFTQCVVSAIAWPDGSMARAASMVTRVAAGPGLEDVPFPE